MDLNSDLGEGYGRWALGDDDALLEVVTSANVACGFHAGDPATIDRTVRTAVEHGVAVGAQVSYPDLVGFGRREMDIPAAALCLRIVGTGPEEPALRRLAGELGLADRVRWDGQLPQAELAGRYRRAAVLVVPGRDEGLGLVAVEGQLSGAPVVAAASGGLLDVVADGRPGRTFPPGDPDALARTVEAVLADPVETTRMAAAAMEWAAARFGTAGAARAYAAVYLEALRKRR